MAIIRISTWDKQSPYIMTLQILAPADLIHFTIEALVTSEVGPSYVCFIHACVHS